MSTDTLKADLKATTSKLQSIDPTTFTTLDLVNHLRDDLWPTLQSMADELEEIDGALQDVVEGVEDILQPETAEVFGAVFVEGLVVSAALKKMITREKDPGLWKVVEEFERNCKAAAELLEEVTIPEDADAEDDPDADPANENGAA